MEYIDEDKLESKINQLKLELILIAEATGLNSYETLSCSQKLDKYIMNYQKGSYDIAKIRVFENEHNINFNSRFQQQPMNKRNL